MSYVQFPKKRIRRVNFYSSKFSGAHFGGSEFEACNFSGSIFDECNATGTKFTESNFRGASLRNADLEGVYFGMNDFSGADFTGANLRGANLHSVDLTKATLSNSILRDADLVTAKGVQASQLTGSDLTGAKLPTSIAEFSAIAHVEKISDQAKTLFLTMLAACSFCILTVGTTTDVNLINGHSDCRVLLYRAANTPWNLHLPASLSATTMGLIGRLTGFFSRWQTPRQNCLPLAIKRIGSVLRDSASRQSPAVLSPPVISFDCLSVVGRADYVVYSLATDTAQARLSTFGMDGTFSGLSIIHWNALSFQGSRDS
jgi:uncharacterized protein YjbI with pentapeptide repeats